MTNPDQHTPSSNPNQTDNQRLNEALAISSTLGFQFAGIASEDQRLRVGAVLSDDPETVGAAVYTRSDIKAAPVLVSQQQSQRSGRKRAIIVNAGNANAFTGKQGISIAEQMTQATESLLGLESGESFVASTGVIGQAIDWPTMAPLIESSLKQLDPNHAENFAKAILTTDTHIKVHSSEFQLDGKTVGITAISKGAGMIMPDMATMLCFVFTNADVDSSFLQSCLSDCTERTFNAISVDGDTSTNDSVMLLANGAAGNGKINASHAEADVFKQQLENIMDLSSRAIVDDGEGVTKFIELSINGTPSIAIADTIGRSIANSPLVKTAFYGKSFNWGRLLMAIGKAQTGIDCAHIDILMNDVQIVKDSQYCVTEAQEDEIVAILEERYLDIRIHFNAGTHQKRFYTCDLSNEYVNINADYLT